MAEVNPQKAEFNPEKYHLGTKMVLIQAIDGNWEGFMTKFGTEIHVREVGPETALQRLLTDPAPLG